MRKGFYTGTVFVIVTTAMAFSEGTTVDDHNRGSTKKITPSGTIEVSETRTGTVNISPSSTLLVNGDSGTNIKTSNILPPPTSVVKSESRTKIGTSNISPLSTSVVNGKSETMTQTSDISPTSSFVVNGNSGIMIQTSNISPSSTFVVNGISETMAQTSDISATYSSVVNGISGTMIPTSDISPTSSSVVNGNSGSRNETDGKNSNESQQTSTLKPKYKTQPLNLDGKVINISSAVHLTTKNFPPQLNNKSSSTYNDYRRVFHNALSKKFQNLRGFIGIVITGFRKGSIIIDYSIKLDALAIVSETNEELNKSLSNINQNWKEFKKDIHNGNITEKLDEDKTKNGIKQFLKNELKTFTNKCNVPGVCGFGFSCVKESCKQICSEDYCNRHGKCVLDYERKKATCACDAFYTGETCKDKNSEVFPSKERLLIIEIAGGAGGGVIMFLFIVLVCVCVQWRKSAGKEKMSDEKKTLKENETFDLRDLVGRSNPIYDKDVENDVAESIPSRRDSFERKLPIFTPSDERMGYRTESFGKPLEYDRRNSERNFIRREDGRIYHVIDEGGPSNQTLIYQPSLYQHSDGSVVDTHAQSPYTDYPRRQNVYDSIDTTREYKITRPNFGRRSQNYDY